jgi:hypothetical protein
MTDEAQPQSFILIKFDETGSAIFNVNLVGVTPFQVMLAGNYLELISKNQVVGMLNQQLEEREAQGLSKPTPKIMLPGQ